MWAKAHELYEQLKTVELNKRKNRTISLVDNASEALRLCLLEIYEDIFVMDSTLTCLKEKNLDDVLWNVIFYSRISELRAIISKFQTENNPQLPLAISELNDQLDRASWFYRSLILIFQSQWKIDSISLGVADKLCKDIFKGTTDPESDIPYELCQRLIHKSAIYLGDIERYRKSILKPNKQNPTIVADLYQYAMRLNVNQGKPMSQLAILATDKGEVMDTVYWYCLSFSNNEPFPVARDNLEVFHSKITKKLPILEADLASIAWDGNAEAVLSNMIARYHRELLFKNDEALAAMRDLNSVRPLHEALVFGILTILRQTPISNTSITIINKIFIILMAGHFDLGRRFALAKGTIVRQRIREAQALACHIMLESCSVISELMLSMLLEGDGAGDGMVLDEGPNSSLELLRPFGLTMTSFSRGLADLVNYSMSFADTDGSTECLPDDVDVVGFAPLKNFYSTLDASTKPDGKFVVKDESTKRLQREKVSQALAVQRLKNEVDSLEMNLTKATIPIIVFDVDCHVKNLKFVKTLLMSRLCVVLVPLDVIQALDDLKKSNEKAREAIRYLEQRFKYKTDYLRAQQHDEVVSWTKEGVMKTKNGINNGPQHGDVSVNGDKSEGEPIRVPKYFRELIGCCIYYRDYVCRAPLNDADLTFCLVTERTDLMELARASELAAMNLKDMNNWLRGKRAQ
ncbi:Protein smg7 [Blyttiomyces sp. JEL0837]|nr:Protein smg7 [Blyttiomyces sp. JEL0837]